VPVQAIDLPIIRDVVCGGHTSQANQAMALSNDGSVFTWGTNFAGELGIGAIDPDASPVPLEVTGLPVITAIDIGGFFKVALGVDGQLYTWGSNWHDNLGHPKTDSIGNDLYCYVPDPVIGLSDVVAVAAGHYHTLAIVAD
jgi:alpha-tubulin suppressor-like RCC1 family protein